MTRRNSIRLISVTLLVIGLVGFGSLLVPGDSRPTLVEARLELGGALLSGVLLSGAFLVAERRLEREDRDHDERAAERQLRAQYQLALGMAESLAGRDLSGLDLSGLRLPGRDLRGTRLSFAILSNANLSQADLNGALLDGADLTGADLGAANSLLLLMEGGDVASSGETLGANLGMADLYAAELVGTKFVGADLSGADLRGADVSGANFLMANLAEVQWTGPVTSAARRHQANQLKMDPATFKRAEAMLAFSFDLKDSFGLLSSVVRWNPNRPPKWPEGFDPPENGWSTERHGA